jgi:hypothetical protein
MTEEADSLDAHRRLDCETSVARVRSNGMCQSLSVKERECGS